MDDRELLKLAAKAAGYVVRWYDDTLHCGPTFGIEVEPGNPCGFDPWNPLADDGDRYRLCRSLGINLDFEDCCAWKRLPDNSLIQEHWGGDCGDEAHAIVRVAAIIGMSTLDAPLGHAD